MANKSRYQTKRESGKMLYGPGCCAHTVTVAQVEAAKRAAEKRHRVERFDAIVAASMRGAGGLSLNFPEG